MFVPKLFLTISILIICVAVTVAGNAATSISDDQAIQKALQFCTKVKWESGATNQYKVRRMKNSRLEEYINIDTGDYYITINATNGNVRAAQRLNRSKQNITSIVNTNKQQAITISDKMVHDLGLDINTKLDKPSCTLEKYMAGTGNDRWVIDYRKMYKGYKYFGHNEAIVITLDSTNGSLVGYSNAGEIAAPASLTVKSTKERALLNASRFLDSHNIHVIRQNVAFLYLVTTDNNWNVTFKEETGYKGSSIPRLYGL